MTTFSSQNRLELDCQQAVADIRMALLELYASVDADPSLPQDVSRRFGLNKNLTWKVGKILQSEDGFHAVQHLPGAAGWDILLKTFQVAGAPTSRVAAVRAALKSFEDFVTLHAGDRAQLELMLDSMGVGNGGNQLENSRALAYQGNSGIWGVQAKVRLTAGYVVPNRDDPTKLDASLVGGLVGFRRLRPNVSWPLFRFQTYNDQGSADSRRREELDLTKPDGDVPRLLRRFCSPSLPPFIARPIQSATEYVLPAGPVGNLGAFNCFFGDVTRGANRFATPGDERFEFSSTVTLPAETMVFDLFVHRDVWMPESPQVVVYGRPNGGPDLPDQRDEEHVLPLGEKCIELGGRPPMVTTPLIPRYAELVNFVSERLGFATSDFRAFRLTLKYPPMSATIVLRAPLAPPTA